MARYIILASLFLHIDALPAQLTGGVVDAKGTELPFANVVVITLGGDFVLGDVTGPEGTFELPLPAPGEYLLRVSSLGHADFTSEPFTVIDTTFTLDFNRITLATAGVDLALAEVSARRRVFSQSTEGMVVDVAASLVNQGSTVLSVLEQSPGVFVDRRTGNLSLYGRSGVTVVIDGQRQQLPPAALLALLEGLPADGVARIELLDNPGAAYDADGGAVIHIHRKEVLEPKTTGSLSLAAGYGYREKGSMVLQLGRGAEAFNWSGSYRLAYDHGLDGFSGLGTEDLSLLGGPIGVSFENLTVSRRTDQSFAYQAERRVSERLSYGVSVTGQLSQDRQDNHSVAAYTPLVGNLLPEFANRVQITSRVPRYTFNPGLYLNHRSDSHGSTGIRLDWLRYGASTVSDIRNGVDLDAPEAKDPIFTPENRSLNETSIDVVSLRGDLVRQWGERTEIEAGFRTAYSLATNEGYLERLRQGEWRADPRTTLTLRNQEHIYAAYLGGSRRIGERGKFSVAARYEYWVQQFSDATGDRYTGRLFPNLTYEHTFSETSRLLLSYSTRIERPNYQDLTANLAYSGPISFFSGNTRLRPATIQRYTARQQLGSLSISLAYVREQSPIARYQFTSDESGTFIVVLPRNVDYQNALELQLTLPWEPAAWWSMSTSALVAHRKFALAYTRYPLTKSYQTFTLNSTQDFSLPANFSLEISGWYNAGFYSGSTTYGGFGAVNVGLRKELPGRWGSLNLTVEDVGKTQAVRSSVGALTPEVFDIDLATTFRPESGRYRLFRLTYVCPLGGGTTRLDPPREAPEEAGRLGN